MAIITNRATLITAIQDYLARDDLSTFAPNFLQNCEGKLYRTLNLRNEETELNVPIGGGVAPLPYRFKALKYAYVDQDPVRLLEWVPVSDIYRRYPKRTVSTTPKVISREGNHFIFGPGAADGTLKGIYWQKQRPLEATSETTADAIVEDSGASTHFISQAITLTATTHTFSVYVRRGSGTRGVTLRASSTNVEAGAGFDLATGRNVLVSGAQAATAFIEPLDELANSWYRIALSFDAAAESTTLAMYLHLDVADTIQDTYTGNGTASIYLWGAQCEASSYPTDMIVTGASPSSDLKNKLASNTELNAAAWTASDVTITANNAAPPAELISPTRNWYTDNAPEVLLYGSLIEAEPFIGSDDRLSRMLPVWKGMYDDAIQSLIDEERMSSYAGRLRGTPEIVV